MIFRRIIKIPFRGREIEMSDNVMPLGLRPCDPKRGESHLWTTSEDGYVCVRCAHSLPELPEGDEFDPEWKFTP